MEELTSPMNSPLFVIKKKYGNQRMVTDLRATNMVIQIMGFLYPGIPLPSLLLKRWTIVLIDMKDQFLIYLYKNSIDKSFASIVPTFKHFQPVKKYQ